MLYWLSFHSFFFFFEEYLGCYNETYHSLEGIHFTTTRMPPCACENNVNRKSPQRKKALGKGRLPPREHTTACRPLDRIYVRVIRNSLGSRTPSPHESYSTPFDPKLAVWWNRPPFVTRPPALSSYGYGQQERAITWQKRDTRLVRRTSSSHRSVSSGNKRGGAVGARGPVAEGEVEQSRALLGPRQRQ